MKSMKDMFEEIYQTGAWVTKHKNPVSLSGPESFPERAALYLDFLTKFIRDNHIQSIVDYGCGDNGLYQGFDWGSTHYTGIDISPTAISIAQKNNPNNTYICDNTLDLPDADMLICKDVLGHWNGHKSTAEMGDQLFLITEWLNKNYNKFSYIIIMDGPDGAIENYFPPHAVFETQFIDLRKKRKKMYIKRPKQGN
jgi:SAM-dependent methyltransferase